jgi:hypothetical protein
LIILDDSRRTRLPGLGGPGNNPVVALDKDDGPSEDKEKLSRLIGFAAGG